MTEPKGCRVKRRVVLFNSSSREKVNTNYFVTLFGHVENL